MARGWPAGGWAGCGARNRSGAFWGPDLVRGPREGLQAEAPLPGPTVVEIGAWSPINDFSDMALEVARSVEGLFAPGDFPIGRNAQGSSQEQALEFLDHLLSR